MATGLVHDPVFQDHDPGSYHCESPRRLEVLAAALAGWPGLADCLELPPRPASDEELTLVHTPRHLQRVAATQGRHASLDPDTGTSPQSHQVARLAAGALIDLCDAALAGRARHGMALLRPPGHHATPERAMGFCLFNNVAIGARWARKRLGYERVMIVDWDVHHGNGTQHSFARGAEVLYCSVHQFPLYPGSGALMETGEGSGRGYTVNVPLISGHGDAEYARVMEELFLPVGRLYRPDLVLVSCGFDCMAGDPVGSMRVTAAGIACLTRRMVELAGEVCKGRLLLVLEGGYNLDNMRTGTLAALGELRGGPLAADHPLLLPPGEEVRLAAAAVPSDGIDQAIAWARNWWALP